MGSRLSQYLKTCRKSARLTQHDVAIKMNLKSSQYVSNVERGNCPPSLLMLQTAASNYADSEEIIRLFLSDTEDQLRGDLKIQKDTASN
jgi:transcriptional regulator with XRE-family HTH domain